MATRQHEMDPVPGMERLLRKDKSGTRPRIDVHSICTTLLSAVLERDGAALGLDEAYNLLSPTGVSLDFKRMQARFGDLARPGEDGVRACLRVILAQLVAGGFLETDGEGWRRGPTLVPDRRLTILHLDDRDTLWVELVHDAARLNDARSDLRKTQDFEHERTERAARLAKLAQKLAPHGDGLRGRVEKAITTIKQSVRDHGLFPDFPIIQDQYGRILDGWQRRYAEPELRAEGILGPHEGWPVRQVMVHSDAHALGIAWAANAGTPFDGTDIKRLENLGYRYLHEGSKTAYAEACLRASAGQRDSKDIADEVGCTERLVQQVRQKLIANGEIISPFAISSGGAPRDEDKRARVRQAWLEQPNASVEDIMARAACGKGLATAVRKELRDAGQLKPTRQQQAQRGSAPRDQDKRARVRAAWQQEPMATREAIAQRTACSVALAGKVRQEMEHAGEIAPKAKQAAPSKEEERHPLGPEKEATILQMVREGKGRKEINDALGLVESRHVREAIERILTIWEHEATRLLETGSSPEHVYVALGFSVELRPPPKLVEIVTKLQQHLEAQHAEAAQRVADAAAAALEHQKRKAWDWFKTLPPEVQRYCCARLSTQGTE